MGSDWQKKHGKRILMAHARHQHPGSLPGGWGVWPHRARPRPFQRCRRWPRPKPRPTGSVWTGLSGVRVLGLGHFKKKGPKWPRGPGGSGGALGPGRGPLHIYRQTRNFPESRSSGPHGIPPIYFTRTYTYVHVRGKMWPNPRKDGAGRPTPDGATGPSRRGQ